MKAALQRIKSTHITLDDRLIAFSNEGILALVEIEESDTENDVDSMAERILQTMLWPEENEPQGEWKKSVQEVEGEILCIPQFTSHGQHEEGSTMSPPDTAYLARGQQQYRRLLKQLRSNYQPQRVKSDVFEAMMAGPLSKGAPISVSYESTDSVVTIKIVTQSRRVPTQP